MSMYLKTNNPEAAAAIEHENKPRFPHVGQMVQFFPRPGEGAGRQVLPAMVMGVRDHENVNQARIDVLVFFGQDHTNEFVSVPRKTLDHAYPAWNFIGEEPIPLAPAQPERTPAAAIDHALLCEEIDELKRAIRELTAKRGPGRPKKVQEAA